MKNSCVYMGSALKYLQRKQISRFSSWLSLPPVASHARLIQNQVGVGIEMTGYSQGDDSEQSLPKM